MKPHLLKAFLRCSRFLHRITAQQIGRTHLIRRIQIKFNIGVIWSLYLKIQRFFHDGTVLIQRIFINDHRRFHCRRISKHSDQKNKDQGQRTDSCPKKISFLTLLQDQIKSGTSQNRVPHDQTDKQHTARLFPDGSSLQKPAIPIVQTIVRSLNGRKPVDHILRQQDLNHFFRFCPHHLLHCVSKDAGRIQFPINPILEINCNASSCLPPFQILTLGFLQRAAGSVQKQDHVRRFRFRHLHSQILRKNTDRLNLISLDFHPVNSGSTAVLFFQNTYCDPGRKHIITGKILLCFINCFSCLILQGNDGSCLIVLDQFQSQFFFHRTILRDFHRKLISIRLVPL